MAWSAAWRIGTNGRRIMDSIFRLSTSCVVFGDVGNFNVFQLFTLKMVPADASADASRHSLRVSDLATHVDSHAGNHHHLLGGHPRSPAAPRAGRPCRRLLLRPEQKERECSAVCPKTSTSCAQARCVGSNKRASSPPKGKICFNSATTSAHVAGR